MFNDAYENDDPSLDCTQEEIEAAAQECDWDNLTAQYELELWEKSRPVYIQPDDDCPPF